MSYFYIYPVCRDPHSRVSLSLARQYTVFLSLPVNQTAACSERRHSVPLFVVRVVSWKREPRRFLTEESQSGDLSLSRRSTGVPWPPEGNASRFDADSCGSPGTVRRTAGGKKVERETRRTGKRKVDGGEPSDWFPPLSRSSTFGVNSRDVHDEWRASGMFFIRPSDARFFPPPPRTAMQMHSAPRKRDPRAHRRALARRANYALLRN